MKSSTVVIALIVLVGVVGAVVLYSGTSSPASASTTGAVSSNAPSAQSKCQSCLQRNNNDLSKCCKGPTGKPCDSIAISCTVNTVSGLQGPCAQSTYDCTTFPICSQTVFPQTEVCNGIDDDCNGVVDDVAGKGNPCNTGQPGNCAAGHQDCVGNNLQCVQNFQPVAEICNGVDDDCNGFVDDVTIPGVTDSGCCGNGVVTAAAGEVCDPPGQQSTCPAGQICNNACTGCVPLPTPTPAPTPAATPTPAPTPAATPTPAPTPCGIAGDGCVSDADCCTNVGLLCINGFCGTPPSPSPSPIA